MSGAIFAAHYGMPRVKSPQLLAHLAHGPGKERRQCSAAQHRALLMSSIFHTIILAPRRASWSPETVPIGPFSVR